MTIEEYLQIQPKVTFEPHIIERAMGKYGIEAGSEAFQYGPDGTEPEDWVRRRDLAEAEMWEAAALAPSGGGGKVAIGNRSVTEATQTLSRYDRQTFLNKAKELRAKWNVTSVNLDVAKIYDYSMLW